MYALIKNEKVTKMHEIINKIVQQNQSLFGTNPKIDKINIGFHRTGKIKKVKYTILTEEVDCYCYEMMREEYLNLGSK